jgi:hypothetical protein
MLTGFFKSNKPIAGPMMVLLPIVLLPALVVSQPHPAWEIVLLALCTGLLTGLVNLFLIYRSGYLKATYLLGWTWWVVAVGLSRSGSGLSWVDLLAAILVVLSTGFVFTLHQPVGQKDSVALNVGLLGALSSWVHPDATVVLPLAWLGMGLYGHLSLRRVFLTLLPALGTWTLLYPLASHFPESLQPNRLPSFFDWSAYPRELPVGWIWAGVSFLPILGQSIAAMSKAKLVKRHAIQFSLGSVVLMLVWAALLPSAWVWLPGALSVPVALLTANALDYTQRGWIRSIWIFGYLLAAVWSAWGAATGFSFLPEGITF